MAIRWATTAGSIDTPGNWDNGLGVPGPGDDVYLNGLNMTSSGTSDISWLSLSSAANVSPATAAGGSLTISGARNFTITNMYMRTDAVTNTLITITATTGTVSITGTARNGPTSGSSSHCILHSGACSFVFNGSILPQASAQGHVLWLSGGPATIGSSGSPVTCGVAVTGGITVNSASCVFNMWANQFHGAGASFLTLTLFSSAYTNGTVYGGSVSARYGIVSSSASGTHTHEGDVYAGSGGSTPAGMLKNGAGTLILTGNIYSTVAYGVNIAVSTTNGTFNFTGNVICGPTTALSVSGASFVINIGSITRPVTQANLHAVSIGGTSTGSITITNPIAGGTGGSSACAVLIGGTGSSKQLTVPLISGGGAANICGVNVNGTSGTITIDANAIGADFSAAHGILVNGIGATVIVNGKATGNGYGVGGGTAGVAAGIAVTTLSTVSVREIESGPRGQSGIIGPVLMQSSPLNKATYRQTVNGATTELVPAGGGIASYGFVGA